MQVHLSALGCRLNEAEIQTWGQEFGHHGWQMTRKPETADLIVINTCAVTGEAARKSRQHIRKFHRSNPKAKLIVTGCYASLEQQQAEELLGVDLIVPNQQKDQLVTQVLESLDLTSMPTMATEPDETALFPRGRDRAFIKIQDGCRYRCTYCIVTVARGEERSRTLEDIAQEVKSHVSRGIQEIVLAGVHVGGYGSDLDVSLHDLVVYLLENTSVPRIRFASVEPWDLPPNFFELFKNPRVMPHMHLPIQSGSDSVLRRMSRRCKTTEFAELIRLAKEQVPSFNVTTDLIVGFPGETEEEWQQTLEFVKGMPFGHMHIFSFSPREGTKAARLPNQLDKNLKKQRSQQLHALAHNIKNTILQNMVGQRVEVLWESDFDEIDGKVNRFYGHTENFHKIAIDLPINGPKIQGQVAVCEVASVMDERVLLMA
ncbi:MAG: tRNA (N(6)-L-threonylcarbamoyladenosine(37)-C(2))-methylthiotransferase MtaB, partial [Pseudomonadota bacterium]